MVQYLLSVHGTEGDNDPSPEVIERMCERLSQGYGPPHIGAARIP